MLLFVYSIETEMEMKVCLIFVCVYINKIKKLCIIPPVASQICKTIITLK